MSDSKGLYDVRERTGNPEHASVDDVVELVFERAQHPRTDHRRASRRTDGDCRRQVRYRPCPDRHSPRPCRRHALRTATQDLEVRNVDGVRIGTTAGQFLDELNAQDDG